MAWLTSHGLGVMGSIPVNASSLLDQSLGFKASETENLKKTKIFSTLLCRQRLQHRVRVPDLKPRGLGFDKGAFSIFFSFLILRLI